MVAQHRQVRLIYQDLARVSTSVIASAFALFAPSVIRGASPAIPEADGTTGLHL
jgi:hypothetical protein